MFTLLLQFLLLCGYASTTFTAISNDARPLQQRESSQRLTSRSSTPEDHPEMARLSSPRQQSKFSLETLAMFKEMIKTLEDNIAKKEAEIKAIRAEKEGQLNQLIIRLELEQQRLELEKHGWKRKFKDFVLFSSGFVTGGTVGTAAAVTLGWWYGFCHINLEKKH